MTEHPSIAAMMNSGYEHGEPKYYSKCIRCNEEIFIGDSYVDTNSYDYCSDECMTELAFEEGNAVRRIAGEHD